MDEIPEGKLTGEKAWLILDGRAWEDPDRAAVYEAFSSHKLEGYDGDTLESVKKTRDEDWPDGVVFEYDEWSGDDGKTYIINEKLIG